MNHRQFFRSPVPFLFLILVLTLSGCSKKGSSEASSSFTPGETHVLVPQADGSNTIGGDPLLLDLSHTDQGYFIGTMSGDGGKHVARHLRGKFDKLRRHAARRSP